MEELEKVTLELGYGGFTTRKFIKQEVLSRFGNPSLQDFEDGSYVSMAGIECVLTTDSYIVDPPVFPGGDIGRLAVSGTINDLVASGATPLFLTMGLVISEGFSIGHLHKILDSMATIAQESGIQIVAGDTKVVPKSCNLGICINTTGLGLPVRPFFRFRLADALAGDKIIITGTLGDHALAILSEREGLGFEQRVHSDCAPLNSLILPLLSQIHGIHSLRDPTRGGFAGVLHDLAEATGLVVHVERMRVPIEPEVRFGCEMLGLDPLEMVNEGKMVVIVSAAHADRTLRSLRDHVLGRQAAIVGEVRRPDSVASSSKVIIMEADGSELLLDRLEGERLPRMC